MHARRFASKTLVLGFLVVVGCNRKPEPPDMSPPTAARTMEATLSPSPVRDVDVPSLPRDSYAQGWIKLFDDETLFGWEATSDANWHVRDGAIHVDEGERGLLCTTSRFSDYELRLEFRAAAGTNSGIFLRTPRQPTDPGTDCYELNIAPQDNPFPTGSLVQRAKVTPDVSADEWHRYEITLDGPNVTVVLDGETVLEYEDPDPIARGLIGLQLNSGAVAFRNIRLRPLGLQSIFDGESLAGWKSYPDMDSTFSVLDNGVLHVEGGPGQLESEASYGDFVLQLECRTNDADLNSGIFFRCIPGERMNGYESQIHNGYRGDDRRDPVDAGTGAIFRRQAARLVVSDDFIWFHKTIVADGPHLAVWVNGYQVTDWTDERDPDPNPRRGLRLEPGTLMIQGHDPTTDIWFRGFKIKDEG